MTKDELKDVARDILFAGPAGLESASRRFAAIREHDPILADKLEAFGALKENLRAYVRSRIE